MIRPKDPHGGDEPKSGILLLWGVSFWTKATDEIQRKQVMEKLGLSPESKGLLQFTVLTNVSNQGATMSSGTLNFTRGRRQVGRKGAELSAPG